LREPSKVSLIVPTFNQAEYLGTCLDSLYFQDYPDLEIIVVDDCSTDHTRQLLDEFTQAVTTEQVSFASNYNEKSGAIERTCHYRYPREGRCLQIIHNEKNMGSTWTYNRGFQASTGKYCTYVASDDICHPHMISTMAEILDKDEADLVYSDMFIIDDTGRILRKFKLPDYSFDACFLNWYLCGVSKLYRRELHEKFGFYDTDYLANDHECYLRFAANGVRFKHIPKVLYSVRYHANRDVGVHSPANWKRLLDESCGLVRRARSYRKEQVGED
jgi:glycosyltransferase involved in cell wall biosynthesis